MLDADLETTCRARGGVRRFHPRAKLVQVYEDNKQLVQRQWLAATQGTFVSADTFTDAGSPRCSPGTTRIAVVNTDTASALLALVDNMPAHTVGALNFANASSIGGGYTTGASAQEEDLCRVMPQLYDQLSSLDYPLPPTSVHHATTWVRRDPCNYDLLEQPRKVVVLSAAMPNQADPSQPRVRTYEWSSTVEARIRAVLEAAQQCEVSTLVLGAFGCGAFRNPPFDVASCFVRVLSSTRFVGVFDSIVFAILEHEDPSAPSNLSIFKQVLSQGLCSHWRGEEPGGAGPSADTSPAQHPRKRAPATPQDGLGSTPSRQHARKRRDGQGGACATASDQSPAAAPTRKRTPTTPQDGKGATPSRQHAAKRAPLDSDAESCT